MIAATIVPGVLGLLVGSFLNVVVHRVPAGKSIVSPASSCPRCSSPIKPYDNIPVLSWVLLRGKCRTCTEPISKRYPLVEVGTSVLFIAAAVKFAPLLLAASTLQHAVAAGIVLIAFLYLAAISVALALIDIDVHRLPDAIVLPAYLVAATMLGAASVLTGDYAALFRAAIAGAALFLAYLAMTFIYAGGMGLGDVKLAGVLGIYLGWVGWGAFAVGAFGAFLLAGIYAVVLIATRRAGRKSGIPFGPWMLVSAWIGVFTGNVVFAGYLSLFGIASG